MPGRPEHMRAGQVLPRARPCEGHRACAFACRMVSVNIAEQIPSGLVATMMRASALTYAMTDLTTCDVEDCKIQLPTKCARCTCVWQTNYTVWVLADRQFSAACVPSP